MYTKNEAVLSREAAVNEAALEKRTHEIGEEIFRKSRKSDTSLFEKNFLSDFLIDKALKNSALKTELFRFVDVLPTLATSKQIVTHITEYFLRAGVPLPLPLKWVLKLSLSNPLTAFVTAQAVKKNIFSLAHSFITGENAHKAHGKLERLWREGFAFTVDILGEAVVSEREAWDYQGRYLELVENLPHHVKLWPESARLTSGPLGSTPRANVSVKCSSLHAPIGNLHFRDSVEHIKDNLRPILSCAQKNSVFIYLDMEQHDLKEIILTVAHEIFLEKEFHDTPHFGVVIQTYLKTAEQDLRRVIRLSQQRGAPLSIRLVKGAYWDSEVILAHLRGWDVPVFLRKNETDAMYERCTRMLLDAFPHVFAAFASHNVRSLSHALAYAELLGLAKNALEVQMLYGMSGAFKFSVRDMGYRVREYAPIGEMLPGMAYLVRRLMENTANEGFLRARFVDKVDTGELLQAPLPALPPSPKQPLRLRRPSGHPPPLPIPLSPCGRGLGRGERKDGLKERTRMEFKNESLLDFSREENRIWIDETLAQVRKRFPQKVSAVINGQVRTGTRSLKVFNPSDTQELVAELSLSGRQEVQEALAVCEQAKTVWADLAVDKRIDLISRAVEIMRQKRRELTALIVLEVGKPWREADADVCEAIDFCRYYSSCLEGIVQGSELACAGEVNVSVFKPRGTAVSIAPWNFPLAILCGMTVAPLLCGCPVIMKPAEQASAIGFKLYEILRNAGVPAYALHFLPGLGEEVGEVLVKHPQVHVISFTGSRTVGLNIYKEAACLQPGQKHVKKVIAEMGGKNAVIVDDDADLDEAVLGCLQSAFGYSGQKCSALSRIFLVRGIHAKFTERFLPALHALTIGPAFDVKTHIGPVIDDEAMARLLAIIERLKKDVIFQKKIPDGIGERGHYVPPTVFASGEPRSELGQEEFFGPLVTLFPVLDFDQAIAAMNDVDYALTGGIYSRSPVNIERAKKELEVGNLYINREITGAQVCRQPFGGYKLSGVGGKAGGPDYLSHFLEPCTITENTMRRGFAPSSFPSPLEGEGGR